MHLDFPPVISNVRAEFPKFHRKRTQPSEGVRVPPGRTKQTGHLRPKTDRILSDGQGDHH
ncbi:hypothetical protein PsAD2_04227 [Pseudovibrio axinellae]|uniref:Uncharacterized protein n=1 Tax=Pseudovibrio axinellae TaxID=989403 RepID=A0A165TWC9_9HYPH|nr:hypothetical protein PsAD2_04227 [Pseudovibrio axinellae]SER61556.1 hypothetical protein SAMN05421798_11439 [Pseudovibrio axinellae]